MSCRHLRFCNPALNLGTNVIEIVEKWQKNCGERDQRAHPHEVFESVRVPDPPRNGGQSKDY